METLDQTRENATAPRFRSNGAADRAMRRLLETFRFRDIRSALAEFGPVAAAPTASVASVELAGRP